MSKNMSQHDVKGGCTLTMSHHVSVQGRQLSLPEAGFGIFDLETGLWGPIGPGDSAVDILQDWEDEDSNAAEFFLVVSISFYIRNLANIH